MPSRLILHTVLASVVWAALCGAVPAQDFLPVDDDSDRVDSILNAPDPSEHAGLLGKVYLQQRYVQMNVNDPDVRQIDKSLQGFDMLFNLPAMTLDLPVSLDFDVFFGYMNAGLKGTAATGAPLNLIVGLNAKTDVYTVGTSIYPTNSERWRPFVQLGAQFQNSEVSIVVDSGPPPTTFATTITDHNASLLFNGGFEFDLLDALGYRLTLHAETQDRFQNSMITNELIWWPHDRIFIRGGMASPLGGNGGLGFAIGGGLAF